MEKIVKETIDSLINYIPKMIVGCEQATENLQLGDEATALQIFPDILEGIDWIIQALTGLQANGQIQYIDISTLLPFLKEMLESLEIGDYVLLADLLNYEIVPLLNSWNEVLLKNVH